MKSYLQGLITGGVFVFAFMVLTANQNSSIDNLINSIEESEKQRKGELLKEPKVGKYQLVMLDSRQAIMDTETGLGFIRYTNDDTYKYISYEMFRTMTVH